MWPNTKGKLSINSDTHTHNISSDSSNAIIDGVAGYYFFCVEKTDLCAIPAIIIPDLVFSFRLIRENYKIIGF